MLPTGKMASAKRSTLREFFCNLCRAKLQGAICVVELNGTYTGIPASLTICEPCELRYFSPVEELKA